MDLKYIHYIQTIARLKSISAAAKELYITQPTLSQCLKKYEDELGYPIFSRLKQGLHLTREGQIFLDTATQMLCLERAMKNQLSNFSDTISGTITFGMSSHRAPLLLPIVLPQFHQKYPNITINILEGRTKVLENVLARGEIDVGFLIPPLNNPRIPHDVFTTEELFLAVPKSYNIGHLAHKRSDAMPWISLSDLADYPFLLCDSSNRLCDFTQDLFIKESFQPQETFIYRSVNTISGLASAGMGIAIFPEMFAASSFDLDYYSIGPKGYFRSLSLGYPPYPYRSRPTELFSEFLIHSVKQFQQDFRKNHISKEIITPSDKV